MKTIFCDIDGCIISHYKNYLVQYNQGGLAAAPEHLYPGILPGSADTLLDWWGKGYKIILTTGRPEIEYHALATFLSLSGIYFHKLIMECGSGVRILINDIPLDSTYKKAEAFNLLRNAGISTLKDQI